MSAGLLDRRNAVVLLIDLQEAYRPILHEWDLVERSCRLAVEGAALLGLPIVVTEQYPRGLGRTSAAVLGLLSAGTRILKKRSLSCCASPGFLDHMASFGRRQVLVVGIETHACVNQTVHELVREGYEVHVARDATSSRLGRLVEPAWQRMVGAGMRPTTTEQALLELVRTADAPEFRPLQLLLKQVTE